mmetsp:Transcript_1366/g.4191  ORF Transcript_1366/g.4191 Transcript_1366/m.4191 type:complete len:82 (-) Transcript_1366:395-640(-)
MTCPMQVDLLSFSQTTAMHIYVMRLTRKDAILDTHSSQLMNKSKFSALKQEQYMPQQDQWCYLISQTCIGVHLVKKECGVH